MGGFLYSSNPFRNNIASPPQFWSGLLSTNELFAVNVALYFYFSNGSPLIVQPWDQLLRALKDELGDPEDFTSNADCVGMLLELNAR